VLEWIGVEFSSGSTPIYPNTCGLMRIRLHPNKALPVCNGKLCRRPMVTTVLVQHHGMQLHTLLGVQAEDICIHEKYVIEGILSTLL